MRASLLIGIMATTLTGCPDKRQEVTAEVPAQPVSQAASQAHAGSQPARAAATGKPFKGSVRLDAGLGPTDVKATDVLFIMARQGPKGPTQGRLVGVQRHAKVQFPLEYEMSQKNLMIPGLPFTGPFVVSARLDRDGNPMTRAQDDLYAEFSGDVKAGQASVDLVLKKKGPETATPSSRPSGAVSQPASAPASQPKGH